MITKQSEWDRVCPKCKGKITYTHYSNYRRAVRKESVCKACCSNSGKFERGSIPWNTDVPLDESTRQKISKSLTGRKLSREHRQKLLDNPSRGMLGKKHTEETINRIKKARVNQAPMSIEARKKISEVHKNRKYKPHTVETKRKLRLHTIKQLEQMHGQIHPIYNPNACKIIEEYGKQHGYNFQHAENGGEFHIKELGYWVDGYDREKNVVIEYNEKHHYKPKNKKRDEIRQKEIEDHLGCKFIIIKEEKCE